jgi:hypothetical protein
MARLRIVVARAIALSLAVTTVTARAEMRPTDRPLVLAIASSDVEAIRRAVAGGADVNFVDGNITPLNLAVSMSHSAAVDALLALGADPNVKDVQGRNAIDIARINKNADIEAKLQAALNAKAPPAPAPIAPQPAAPAPAAPTPQPAPLVETGTFDDVQFATPDAKLWTPTVVDNNLVFSSPLPPPDFCTITVYASRDLKGGEAELKAKFDELVQASLKNTKTVAVKKDSGPLALPQKKPGLLAMQRVLYCETQDFHVAHFFVALHSQDRMQLIAYQASGHEMFQKNQADAEKFLSSVSVVTSKTLNP